MNSNQIKTSDDNILLVPVDIERDAPLGVTWLAGDSGRETLRMMGVTDKDNHESTLESERERLTKMIVDPNEIAWMIELEGKIVGVVEVRTDATEYIPAPHISIMIGDPAARGKGVGSVVIDAVVGYLFEKDYNKLYARHLLQNAASAHLFEHCGFLPDGEAYTDTDGLKWQNVAKSKA